MMKCPLCSAAHKIYGCDMCSEKCDCLKEKLQCPNYGCFNCLNYGHQVWVCKFSGCAQCDRRHNFRLHSTPSAEGAAVLSEEPQTPREDPIALYTEVLKSPAVQSSMSVMLATAIVHVIDKNGVPRPYRAVLDSGLQLNFVTFLC